MTIGNVSLLAGRITAGLLLLFWGAFFVVHTMEWFLRGDGKFPPAWVAMQHGFHLLILVGLAAMLKWDRVGAAILIVSTIAFFGLIGIRGFPWIALINLIPLVCFALYWAAGHTSGRQAFH